MNNEDPDFTEVQMLRMKAEEQLSEKQKNGKATENEVDVNKLLHELQVHQIELEMQNEELRRAYETSEAAVKKYTLLYDLAPVGFFTLDSGGIISELNFTGAKMLGSKRFSLIDRSFKLFIARDFLNEFDVFFKLLYSSNVKQSCEIRLEYQNNPLCLVYMEGITTGDDGNCLLSMIDISNFRNAK